LVPGSQKIFVVTGPSGAGKGTMVRALLARVPQLRLAVSATTRARRPGEDDGVHYWFLSDEEFDRRLAAGDFLEYHTFPWGQRSGTLRSELERIAAEGNVPLLELELNGSIAVKEKVPGAVTLFVDAPLAELERRLRERATESSGEIDERIALASEQKSRAREFDHVVENDDRDRAAAELVAIVERELLSASAEMQASGVSGADGRTGKARTS
jgi:guanylate kinase